MRVYNISQVIIAGLKSSYFEAEKTNEVKNNNFEMNIHVWKLIKTKDQVLSKFKVEGNERLLQVSKAALSTY